MIATDFEYRHRAWLHLAVVSLAFLTYVVDRDDVVWALVKGHGEARLLERAAFTLATLLIGAATALRTWSQAQLLSERSESVAGKKGVLLHLRYPLQVGSLLFAIGLGFLAPLPGFIFLVTAEAILAIRLIARQKAADRASSSQPTLRPATSATAVWRNALRLESGKWGLFFTMIVFTLLLNDRLAELLGAISFVLAMVLNYKSCYSSLAS
jgi:hypothetical protein